jgi:ubiquinone/menaquinone biosynthesis C-methylase UbiE
MDARLQNRIQRYGWNHAADLYEAGWAEQLRPGHDLLLELAGLEAGDHVLDVACGAGLVTFRAADIVGSEGFVLGTDISDAMIARASAAARPGVSFLRQDAEAAPREAAFDAALCAFGLMYTPDPVAALAAMRAGLKPIGRAVAAVWGPRARCGWASVFPIVDARVQSEVCPLFFQLGAPGALAAAFEQAGYRDVRERRITTVLRYETAEDALKAAFEAGPVALAYGRFDAETRASAHAEYLDSIAPFRDRGGYSLAGEFVVAVGRASASDASENGLVDHRPVSAAHL